jgi:orotate phosphoribosyltransferase
MNHQIVLSPDLGLSADDFAAAWNADPECRAVAEAQLKKSTHTYDPTAIFFAVLTGIPIGITANFLTDLIRKTIFAKQPSRKRETLRVEIQEADGSRVVIVYEKSEEG